MASKNKENETKKSVVKEPSNKKKTIKKTTPTENPDINKIDTSKEKEENGIEVVEVLEIAKNKITGTVKKAKTDKNPTYLFFKGFVKRLKEDKLYLFSLIITIIFFCFFSLSKMKNTEGYYDRKEQSNVSSNVTVPTDPTLKDPTSEETPVKSDDLDVSDYVGTYSREVTLATPIKINSTCEVSSLKFVYEIKKDKKISKYVTNECLGTYLIWSDTLAYVSTGGARYISANNINFLFSSSSMKEVDADTYKLDEEVKVSVDKKISELEVYFKNNNIIFNTKQDLILVKGSTIAYKLSDDYNTKISNLNTVAKSSKDNVFRFIAYENENSKQCFTKEEIANEGLTEQDLYKIYSIKYNESTGTFNSASEIQSRKNTDTCEKLNEDIASLSK